MRLLRYEIARIYSCKRESSGLIGTLCLAVAWMPDTPCPRYARGRAWRSTRA